MVLHAASLVRCLAPGFRSPETSEADPGNPRAEYPRQASRCRKAQRHARHDGACQPTPPSRAQGLRVRSRRTRFRDAGVHSRCGAKGPGNFVTLHGGFRHRAAQASDLRGDRARSRLDSEAGTDHRERRREARALQHRLGARRSRRRGRDPGAVLGELPRAGEHVRRRAGDRRDEREKRLAHDAGRARGVAHPAHEGDHPLHAFESVGRGVRRRRAHARSLASSPTRRTPTSSSTRSTASSSTTAFSTSRSPSSRPSSPIA